MIIGYIYILQVMMIGANELNRQIVSEIVIVRLATTVQYFFRQNRDEHH